MGSEVGDLDWDPTSEEELRSIEEAYYSSNSNFKRRPTPHQDIEASDHQRSKGRRLPNWANQTISAVDCAQRSLSLRPCQVNLKAKYPEMNFGGRIVYCRTAAEVERAAVGLFDKIKNAAKQTEEKIPLGFDIEWRPIFTKGAAPSKAAVMQICMDTSHCYVMHIIHSGIPPLLKSLLEDCSSVKVGICIASDATKISRDYNVRVEPLEELSRYANLKLGGTPKSWSLSSLTERLTCKQLAKPSKIRMGNWEATKLSKAQLQYASTDAFTSWYLYEVLKTFTDAKPETGDMEKTDDVIS